MKNSEYWRKRFEQLEEAQLSKGLDYYNELERQYRVASKSIEDQIAGWYNRFAQNNNITFAEAKQLLKSNELKEFKWTVKEYIKYGKENAVNGLWMKQLENASAKVHISRLEALQLQVQQQCEVLYGNQIDGLDRTMRNIYSDGYYHTAYEIQKGFNAGYDLHKLNERQLAAVISKPWTPDGNNFVNRCWTAKDQLVNTLHTELTQAVIRGDAPDKAIKNIAQKFNTSKANAGRLVMTESAFFASAAQRDCFNDLGVERYEIVATLDTHTSSICRHLDGKVFDMKDYKVGATAPPFHCWCRSVTVPYFEDNTGSRAARSEEGEIYYIPSDLKYEDWKNTFLVDYNLSKEMFGYMAQLRDFEIKEYKNIWKNDVTTLDYHAKKDSIPSKRNYFEDQLKYSASENKEKFTKLLFDLNEFEQEGKRYFELKNKADLLRKQLQEKLNGCIIIDNKYSQERKDAAYWFKDKAEADAVLRGKTGELWRSFTADEKGAIYSYTSGSGRFNRPLRGYEDSWNNFKGVGKVDLNSEGAKSDIINMTNALKKCSYDFDIWLQRGVETDNGAASFLGISRDELLKCTQEELESLLLGKTVKDEAFLSTSAAKGSGFSGHIFNIYAPKGTKMIYAEPFSAFGEGGGRNWDGYKTQNIFGYEFEVILQRGYEYRIIKVERSGGNLYFDIEVQGVET